MTFHKQFRLDRVSFGVNFFYYICMTVTIALFYVTFVKNLPVKHVQVVRVYNRSEQNATASLRMSQVAAGARVRPSTTRLTCCSCIASRIHPRRKARFISWTRDSCLGCFQKCGSRSATNWQLPGTYVTAKVCNVTMFLMCIHGV